MSGEGPPELRQLDTSRARKEVVTTQRAQPVTPAPEKGAGAAERGQILGLGLTFTSLAAVVTLLLGTWPVAAAALLIGLVVTFVLVARAVEVPRAASAEGDRIARLTARLAAADLPEAADRELKTALASLAAARERETAARASVARSLASLDGPALEAALAEAQAGGDPAAIALRQEAVDTWRGLQTRLADLDRGHARSDAALDALDATLAQAESAVAPAASTLDADSQRLLGQVQALRHAAAELEDLETEADRRPPPTTERA